MIIKTETTKIEITEEVAAKISRIKKIEKIVDRIGIPILFLQLLIAVLYMKYRANIFIYMEILLGIIFLSQILLKEVLFYRVMCIIEEQEAQTHEGD